MISAGVELFDLAIERLSASFGPAETLSAVMDFDFTHYYDAEMGSPLQRRFAAFERLIAPDALVDAKSRTNELERMFAAAAPDGPRRPINLDPGYVDEPKLVLASMKDFAHRVYLGRGVFGEVTLMYRNGRWEGFGWTFPDYASGRYDSFLTSVRESLRRERSHHGAQEPSK